MIRRPYSREDVKTFSHRDLWDSYHSMEFSVMAESWILSEIIDRVGMRAYMEKQHDYYALMLKQHDHYALMFVLKLFKNLMEEE